MKIAKPEKKRKIAKNIILGDFVKKTPSTQKM